MPGDALTTQDLILRTIEQLRDDFADERRMAHESRAVIHKRLDEQHSEIAELRTTVTISAHVDAQVREEVRDLKGRITKTQADVEPSIAEWKRMKAIGIGIGGLLAIGGLSIASMLAWAGEAFINWLRHLLKIG